MKAKSCISFFYFYLFTFHFSLLSFYFLLFSPAALFAAEPNKPSTDSVRIKMLHIFIRADVNDVRFDNIWVFENQGPNSPWQIIIDLPDQTVLLGFEDPNQIEFMQDSGTIHKKISADSPISRLDFSFVLPNQAGKCRTQIKPGYRVDSILVSVSGPATQFTSDVLKLSNFMASQAKLPRIYSAGDLAADTKIDINLSRLPCQNGKLLKALCLAGLALIVIIALFTIYHSRTIKTDKVCTNETHLE